jgi:tetratricopeptide (TPR) repeat protein
VILPKAIEEQGYTGLGAANRISDEIRQIEEATETFARKDKSIQTSSEQLPDIEIPETKLSLASAISLLEDFLPVALAPRHVNAELIFKGADWHEVGPTEPETERVIIYLPMTGAKSPPRWTSVTVHNPDEAVTLAARQVLEMTNPYILSVYAFDVEHDPKTALQLIQEALTRDPRNAIIYDGWGRILDYQKNYKEESEKYQQAITIDPNDRLAVNTGEKVHQWAERKCISRRGQWEW